MKPTEQTIIGKGGNCFAACIASILELPIAETPNFHSQNWWEEWQRWLVPRGWYLCDWFDRVDDLPPPGYAIHVVKSPRIEGTHAVVTFKGEIVFDPHPEREKGIGERMTYQVLVPINPIVK